MPTTEQAPQPEAIVPVADALYSMEETAAILKASPRKVRRWWDERRLGYVQHPRGRCSLGRHIIDYIEARAVEPEE